MAKVGEIKNSCKNNKMLGVHVREEIHHRFKLIAVYQEVYLSNIMKELYIEFLKTQPSEKKLIYRIAKRAHEEWDNLCIKMHNKVGWKTSQQLSRNWEVFVDNLREKLKIRRLQEDYVEAIIVELQKIEIDR